MSHADLCPNCFQEGFKEHCNVCGYGGILKGSNPLFLLPGTVLVNRYYLGRALGAGGFGITYLAKDLDTGNIVALKEYLPSMLAVRDGDTLDVYASSSDNQQIFLHGRDMFLKEAGILKLFHGNEKIVQVMDSFNAHGTAYFVMEYLDGINVKQLMRSMNGSLSPQMAMEILVQTGEALAQVHRQGLLHRDVSPENIIIDRDGGMKLIDFGATRFFMGEKSRSLSVIIKPGFAPPEQYSSKGNQGAWTDIYALCATVWHTISGLQIPDAPSRIAQEPLPPLPAQVETECPGLIQILRKGLETDYRKRWKSVEEMLAAAGGPGVLGSEVSGSGMPGSGVPGSDPYLQIYQNQAAGDKWMIPKQMQMRIGRSSDTCNIVIDDPNISRVHCIVHYDGKTGDFYLSDQSSNGTFADGQRLSSERVYTLAPGSFFELIPGRIAIKTGVE